MEKFEISYLSNGIKVITKKNKNAPRTAVNVFIGSGIKNEITAGATSLAGRLLLQGTSTRNAEQLAQEIDTNALEINVDTKHDYVKIKSIFLNEDLDIAVDLLSDIILNSTFENFEKERRKFKNEIEVELDSPRAKALDNLIKNLYPDHPYGNTHTRVLNGIEQLNLKDVKNLHYSSLSADKMNITAVGNFEKSDLIAKLEANFSKIAKTGSKSEVLKITSIPENRTVTIAKNDAAQAQVIQGWIAPEISSQDYPALSVLNTLLGSSGLSSRLFVELRDKRGLAYVVRSSYEPLEYSGIFSVYIATAPNNIKDCIEGFKTEIAKLKSEPVSLKELEDAKNNILGKREFFHETNAQQAHYLGYYDIMGLGADFDEKISEKIKNVTSEDIMKAANKYLSGNSVISLLAPEDYLTAFE